MMKALLERIKRYFHKCKTNDKQFVFIFCPMCDKELIRSKSKWIFTHSETYKFTCNECGTITNWLFDPPVPILIKR